MQIGFFGLLALLFIGLKLGNVINWSWIWVLSPLWGGIAFVLILFFIGMMIGLIADRPRPNSLNRRR